MTFRELANQVRANIDNVLEQRQAQAAIVLRVSELLQGENREPSEGEAEQVRAAQQQIAGFDTQITDLRERAAAYEREAEIAEQLERDAHQRGDQSSVPVRIGSEPETYSRETSQRGVSLFRDMYAVFRGKGSGQVGERLARYERESEGRRTKRAASTNTFAGIIPPQYLVDEAAILARAGRPIANSVRKLPLPAEGMSFVIPRGTTGAAVAPQPTENSNVANQDEAWANLTVPVFTIAGQNDVSRQALERGGEGIDSLIFADLAASYGVSIDQQVISGTGASGQGLGILNTAGIAVATAFDAAVTPQSLLLKTAGAINAVQTKRFLAPDVIWMHPQRWSWLIAQVDDAKRPLVVPNPQGPNNAIGTFDGQVAVPSATPVGNILGVPVVTDASIPTAVGAGSEDQVIVARWEDLILWEDNDGNPTDLMFEQTLGNQLTVKLVAYGYGAFTAGRYPGAVATIGGVSTAGNGLVTPTF